METNTTTTEKELFTKMIISTWESQNMRVNKLLDTLSDEQLLAEAAPGRNTGIYLLGHLAAVNDALLPLLGFCPKLYPELENIFLKNPDKSGLEKPSLSQVKAYWHEINAKLTEHIHQTSPDEWFGKHTAVSAEDFAKEPHRNKLNVLNGRAIHQSQHLGQMIYLGGKNE